MCYYIIYRQYKILWSLEVKYPRTSMTFERFALKRPCVSWHVLSSFTCLFRIKFMWEVLNSYTNIFKFETSEQTSLRTIQGSLRKDPSRVPKLSKTSPTYGGNRRPVGGHLGVGDSNISTRLIRKPWTNRTVRWLSYGSSIAIRLWGLPPCAVHCNIRGEIVNSPYVQIRSLEFN